MFLLIHLFVLLFPENKRSTVIFMFSLLILITQHKLKSYNKIIHSKTIFNPVVFNSLCDQNVCNLNLKISLKRNS
jgi:CRISPR/Cas system CSM-associated protein Csm4 (group 5 of RAMP superfamily)